MLKSEDSVLIIADVQGRLAHAMYEKERLFEHLSKLIQGVRVLGVPILWVEQNPDGLGPTIPEVADLLPDLTPIPKFSFSCCGCELFLQAFRALDRRQVLIAGIEAHVCVYQTAMELLEQGLEVQVVSDAVSSRTPENREIGLGRIRDAGGMVTSTEMALFEMLQTVEGPQFKEMLSIVK
ncbi:MAG: hydrolase [Candidatus Latescibacterota bacterium]